MTRTLFAVPLVLALAITLTGCPEGDDDGTTAKGSAQPVAGATTAATEAPDSGPAPNAPKLADTMLDPLIEDMPTGKYGGSVVAGAYEDPKTFNATMATDSVSARFITYLFDTLVEEDGTSYEVEPVLAKSWEVSKDGKEYIFKLRRGVTWHDGKPLTADDVVFTFMKVMTNPDIPWDARDTVKIDGKLPVVTKIDDHTVKFTLPKPFAPFLRTTATAVVIFPKHIFEPWVNTKGPNGKPLSNSKYGVDTDLKAVVGSGAWMVDSYQPGERITFKRNPNYFRVNRHKQPLPYLDRLVVPFLKTVETAILKFKAGETDAQWLPGNNYAYMKPEEQKGNFTIIDAGPDFRTTYLGLNLNQGKNKDGKPYVDPIKQKWFADTRFRQALAYAIDKQAIIKNVFRGLAAEQNSPIFQKSPFYDPTTPSYPLDRDKAMKLLTEAGFKKEGDVLKDATGHPVEFTMLKDVGSKDLDLRANMIKEDFKKIGINMKFQPVTFNVKLARTHESKDWEVISGDWGAGIEPHGVAHLWNSNGQAHFFNLNASPNRNPNPTYPWEKRIDEIFDQGASELDEAKRKALYNEFQQIVGREQVMIFLPVFNYTLGVRNNLGNARPNSYNPMGITWNAWELYRK